jgi:hypothetical protein
VAEEAAPAAGVVPPPAKAAEAMVEAEAGAPAEAAAGVARLPAKAPVGPEAEMPGAAAMEAA